MKEKVTIILDDDTDNEGLTLYTVNSDGVVVIDDELDDSNTNITTTHCFKDSTESKRNTEPSFNSKNSTYLPSTSGKINNNSINSSSGFLNGKENKSSTEPNKPNLISKTPQKLPPNTLQSLKNTTNTLSNFKNKIHPSSSISSDPNKPTISVKRTNVFSDVENTTNQSVFQNSLNSDGSVVIDDNLASNFPKKDDLKIYRKTRNSHSKDLEKFSSKPTAQSSSENKQTTSTRLLPDNPSQKSQQLPRSLSSKNTTHPQESTCLSTNSNHQPPVQSRQVVGASGNESSVQSRKEDLDGKTTQQQLSNNLKMKVTIKNQCSNSTARGRTRSAPSGSTKEGECSSSSKQDKSLASGRQRTKSAPDRTTTVSRWFDARNKNCSPHTENGSCSTASTGKNKSKKRKRNKQSLEHNSSSKRQCMQPSFASTSNTRNPGTLVPGCSNPQTSGASCSGNVTAQNSSAIYTVENLSKFSHILFIDLDNWAKFFRLPHALPKTIFVIGFCGGNYTRSNERRDSEHFRALVQQNRFYQHPKCGRGKNAADFALCVQAARLDLQLPMNIPFTVLSGDKGFSELQSQLQTSPRQIHLVDPHNENQDILYAIVASIGEK